MIMMAGIPGNDPAGISFLLKTTIIFEKRFDYLQE